MLKIASFLFSPVTRIVGWIMAVIAVIGIIYGRGRRDARREIEADANEETLRRTQDAIRARDNASSGELRKNDGHRRD
jgi:hypothetical protein